MYNEPCIMPSVIAFCFQNCSDQLWEKKKIVLSKTLKFEAESLEQFKCTYNIWNRMFSKLLPRGFLDLMPSLEPLIRTECFHI